MVNDPQEVANIFNDYFTIADAIGGPDPVNEDDDVMHLLQRKKVIKACNGLSEIYALRKFLNLIMLPWRTS